MTTIKDYFPNSKLKKDGITIGPVANLLPSNSQNGELVYSAIQTLFKNDMYEVNLEDYPYEMYLVLKMKGRGIDGKAQVSVIRPLPDQPPQSIGYIHLEVHQRNSRVKYIVDAEKMELLRGHVIFKDETKTMKTVSDSSKEELLSLLETIMS